jgi:hypothetical protein
MEAVTMSNEAIVTVRLDYVSAEVIAECSFHIVASEFCFSLSDAMSITNSNYNLLVVNAFQQPFGHSSIKYLVTDIQDHLFFSYRGRAEGWCNLVEETRSAISSYSSWFPFELSTPCKLIFEFPDMPDYVIINGVYNEKDKLWRYGGEEYDTGNIIALKNGHYYTIMNDEFTFYYRFTSERPIAECYFEHYCKIIDFYNSIYPAKKTGKMSAVASGVDNYGGAYYRHGLIMLTNLYIPLDTRKINNVVISLLGHELGHIWFLGADVSTWHDWLNETGAEWSMLLYVLNNGDTDNFKRYLSRRINGYDSTPPIKPRDSTIRPTDGVHSRGVAMFAEIFQKCGADMIIKMLRVLAEMESVTTEEYLSALYANNLDKISIYIESNLNAVKYAAF